MVRESVTETGAVRAGIRGEIGIPRPALARWLAWAVILGLWESAPRLAGISPIIITPLSSVAVRMFEMAATYEVWQAFGLTFGLAGLSFCISLMGGVCLGLLVADRKLLEAVLDPFITTLYSTPKSMFFPIFVLLFGFGMTNNVLFGVFYGFFPIFLTTVAGVREVNPALVTKARSLGASSRQIYVSVILPSIVPALFTGVRIGLNFTLLGMLLAEIIAPQHGIGRLLGIAQESINTNDLLAYILLVSLITIGLNRWLVSVEERLSRWRG